VLDGEGKTLDALAERLGVTSRHLYRLFIRHRGTSPSAVARTARIQRAKRLLDTTNLPISEIAFLAGFGSLRRFNAVFAEVYNRRPSKMRRSLLARSAAE
jgi:AraC family transcriptional regulator, regulatory protein of adaptative response / methylated-DNA-[protein]-cysteine methyltransferase